ncbi:hypothetical protein [Reyranella sp.]|uniref:hypothetical protein n=1 Tax=Reyranella sp. TaxID=1929291 RepID=UPI003BA89397
MELFKLDGSNIASIEHRVLLLQAEQPMRAATELAMREVEMQTLKKTGIHGVRLIADDGTVYLDWDVWETITQMAAVAGFEYRQSRRKADEHKD